MSEWQPIETAPKDGTLVLLYWPDVGSMVVGYFFHRGNQDRVGWRAEPEGKHWFDVKQPTHWMKLPERPI